jgi:hypothetical protein
MKVAYGKDTPTSATDSDVKEAHQSVDRVREVLRPGAYLVNSIPWLKYIPWYGQELKRQFESNKQLYARQLNRVKQQIVSIGLLGSQDV